MRVGCSFSSGKDSMLALKKMLDQGHECVILMTTGSSKSQSWFHDVDADLLHKISDSLQIPLEVVICGVDREYAEDFECTLMRYKREYGIEGFIFGDIDLMTHRVWCSERCNNCGIEAIFPLWAIPREQVVREFINEGFSAYIKKVKKHVMDPKYLGKKLTHEIIDELVEQGIDACGENGEYHTMVLDGVLFKFPIQVRKMEISESEYAYSIAIRKPIEQLAILGCASHVGKTTIAAGICRYLTNRQKKVAPFKAMNISSSFGISKEDLEMGKGQIIQAAACRLKPSILMNPILLKPNAQGMQVLVHGVPSNEKADYLHESMKSYEQLSRQVECIVIEGSGSCAELNRKGSDIANFPIVSLLNAPVILVADIERCGVFASVYGTLMLLSEEERSLVKGIIINKFQGDVRHFDEGKRMLEDLCKIPVLGVIAMHDFMFEEEDMPSHTQMDKNNDLNEDETLDQLAKHLEKYCDMEAILKIMMQ